MSHFKGKTIWIIGASSGIGKQLVKDLNSSECDLLISSRNEAKLIDLKEACPHSENIKVLPLDLENHNALTEILTKNDELISKVDILINNGGISQRSQVRDTSFSVYKKLMDVNYLGNVMVSQSVLPHMIKKGKGHLVITSSIAGKFGVPYRSGYSAAKMALHGFYEALRAELSKTDIKITMLCPGYIRTEISYNALEGDGSAHGVLDSRQEEGMDVEIFSKKAIKAIKNKVPEAHIGGFFETKFAVLVHRLFPSLFRKLIARSRVV